MAMTFFTLFRRARRAQPYRLLGWTGLIVAGLITGSLFAVQAFAHGPVPHSQNTTPAPAETEDKFDPLANRFGGKFTLTDHTGQRVSDETYRGHYLLVYFGFTNCADLCPIDLATMAQALNQTKPEIAEKVQPLFISVDPEMDTPAVLSAYVSNLHPRLIGLTGSVAEVEAAAKAYRVQRHKLLHPASNGHPYIIDHGTLMFLMGPNGKFVSLFPHNSTPEKITQSLERYVK